MSFCWFFYFLSLHLLLPVDMCFFPLSSFTHLSFLCHVCILLAYLSGLFCPSDCLILIIFYLSFGQERPNVGTWPKCILFLSLPPRWRVCLFLSYPLFWPSPVSVCSLNRTKDHALLSPIVPTEQIQNWSDWRVWKVYLQPSCNNIVTFYSLHMNTYKMLLFSSFLAG